MIIQGWKYYNHAAIPTTAPHEEVDIRPIEDKTIWKMNGHPVLARWVSDWDCVKETDWWYIICDAPYDFEKLSKKSRKNIRKSLENCEVQRIDALYNSDDLWRVFNEATTRYSNYEVTITEDSFKNQLKKIDNKVEYWAGYDRNTRRMIGYKVCTVYDDWVDFTVSKYSADFLKLRVSDALNSVVLDYYLNQKNKRYVSNGTRSIVHDTNVQDYYQQHFNFRKAYCKLNVVYKRGFGILIKCLYPFRNLIKPNSSFGTKVFGILQMERIRRKK